LEAFIPRCNCVASRGKSVKIIFAIVLAVMLAVFSYSYYVYNSAKSRQEKLAYAGLRELRERLENVLEALGLVTYTLENNYTDSFKCAIVVAGYASTIDPVVVYSGDEEINKALYCLNSLVEELRLLLRTINTYAVTVGDEYAYRVLKDDYLGKLQELEDGLKTLIRYLANTTTIHGTKGDWFKLVNESAAELEELSDSITTGLKRVKVNGTATCR
jgi:hypothetical protein